MRLLEPGDRVALTVVRAERVLPGDVYWGVEAQRGCPRKGFILESEGVPVPRGAEFGMDGRVRLASFDVMEPDALVLIAAT